MGGAGEFCWVDLAASDTAAAQAFYERMFGWRPLEQPVGAGRFTRLQLAGRDVGSMYQLSAAHRAHGVPSHWTAYVRVADVASASRRAIACGGRIVIEPLDIGPLARIALVMDPVGATLGLWQAIPSDGAAAQAG